MLLYVGNINRQLCRYDMSTFIAEIEGCFVVYEVFDTILTSKTGSVYVSHVFFRAQVCYGRIEAKRGRFVV